MRKFIVLLAAIAMMGTLSAAQYELAYQDENAPEEGKKKKKKKGAKKDKAAKKNKGAKAKAEAFNGEGTVSKKGKGYIITTEDGTKLVINKKALADHKDTIEANVDKKVKVDGMCKAGKKAKTLVKINSIEAVQ